MGYLPQEMATKVNDAQEATVLGALTPQKMFFTALRKPYSNNNSEESQKKLPEKYAMLGEFFECMEISIRLFGLRKKMCVFSTISQKVEEMTKRQFKHAHLAQIKYIIPEALQLEKTLTRDDTTLCMKLDLRITVLPIGSQEGLGSVISRTPLRKTFHGRLLEFADSHPDGDDVPQALLPEPFNPKYLPNVDLYRQDPFPVAAGGKPLDISKPCEDFATVEIRESSAFSLNPAEKVAPIKQEDSPNTIAVSHFPSNFKKHFSQREEGGLVATDLSSSIGIVADLASAPLPMEVKPCSVMRSFSAKIFEDTHELKNADELDHSVSTHLSPTLKPPVSPRIMQFEPPANVTPLKSASMGEDEDDVFTPSPYEIPSLPCTSSSISSSQYQTCASEEYTKQCFSPTTPAIDLDSNNFSTPVVAGASAHKLLNLKSSLKSHPKRSSIKKSLQYGVATTQPFTPGPPYNFVSPGTPAFEIPGTPVVVPSSLIESEDSKIKKSIDFETPSIESHAVNSIEKPLVCCSPQKRKAAESNLDESMLDASLVDSLCTMSPIPLTPAVSDARANFSLGSAESSHLRKPVNPFARPKKEKSIVRILPFESPIKSSSLQKTQEEETPVNELFCNSKLHTSKRSRLNTDQVATEEGKKSVSSSCVRALNFLSPSKKDGEVCKSDFEIMPKLSDQMQQHVKVGSAEIAVSSKANADVAQPNLENVGCSPENLPLVEVKDGKDGATCNMVCSPATKTRQEIIACLPRLLTTIGTIFQSVKRQVMTCQELVHKIILCHYDVTDREEVVQQLQLLEEIVPDWISKRAAISGDLLYSIQKYTDLQAIRMRLMEAV